MDKDTQIKWALETAIELIKSNVMRGTGYNAVLVGLTLASEEIESLRSERVREQEKKRKAYRDIEDWQERCEEVTRERDEAQKANAALLDGLRLIQSKAHGRLHPTGTAVAYLLAKYDTAPKEDKADERDQTI